MKNLKTKKKFKPHSKKTSKYYGGLNKSNTSYDDIMKQVEERNKVGERNNVGVNMFNKISDKVLLLFEELLIEYINTLGHLLGVDISNPQDVSNKLEQIKVIVTDPEIQAKVKIIVERMAIIMDIALEAAKPYAKPLGEKLSNIYVDIAGEFDSSLVRIAKEVIEAIPGLNVIASIVDVSSTAATSIVDVYNAKLKMQNAIANTIEATSINYNNLLKEKGELLNRTNDSINKFSE